MIKEINFDMDGTIADLYSVNNWLDYLINENVYPYVNAKPMLNMNELEMVLIALQNKGYKVNIISWGSKNSSKAYLNKVSKAKRKWLKHYFKNFKFDNVMVVEYGSPKSHYGNGILFDDELNNRNEWNGKAYNEKNIIKILKELI